MAGSHSAKGFTFQAISTGPKQKRGFLSGGTKTYKVGFIAAFELVELHKSVGWKP